MQGHAESEVDRVSFSHRQTEAYFVVDFRASERDLGRWLTWQSACLAGIKLWVRFPASLIPWHNGTCL